MIVTGYDPKKIRELIEKTVSTGVQNQTISSSDVIVTEAVKSTISIKQIRDLLSGLSLTPIRLRKVAVIYDAHKLSLPAANALLKSLEESPAYVRFILATTWASRLPATILSRCTRLRVSDVSGSKPAPLTDTRLLDIKPRLKTNNIEPSDIAMIEEALSNTLRTQGPSQELKMATMRLIDYYRVKGSGGNEKLARDVLLMYLPNN